MYLKSITVKNYFSFDKNGFTLNNLQNKPEIYFVGENGVGKTILLQAIALAISKKAKGEQQIGTVIDILKQNKRGIPVFEASLRKKTNVIAYGINRLSIKGLKELDYRKEESYISLFDNSRNLIDPIYWLQMLELDKKHKRKNIKPEEVSNLLSDLLDKEISIKINSDGAIFKERETEDVSFNQLSDGYKSAITWVSDLLARLSFNQPNVKKLADYEAVVCVDEIGIYLHPALKLNLIEKLRTKFSGIQWIFTTHSPIIMLGASENAVAYKMYKLNGVTKISEPIEIKNHTANSLITSNIWGLDKFYTQNIKPDLISDVDDTYQKIYQKVQETRKLSPHVSNNDLIGIINKNIELENI